jgi:hypothetical protein
MSKKSKATKQQFADTPQTQTTADGHRIIALTRKDGQDTKSITRGADVTHYVSGAGLTPSGRKSFDIADRVADLLRGKTTDEVIATTTEAITAITGECPDLRAKYSTLNPGQVRMNCGNRLRAAYKAEANGQ